MAMADLFWMCSQQIWLVWNALHRWPMASYVSLQRPLLLFSCSFVIFCDCIIGAGEQRSVALLIETDCDRQDFRKNWIQPLSWEVRSSMQQASAVHGSGMLVGTQTSTMICSYACRRQDWQESLNSRSTITIICCHYHRSTWDVKVDTLNPLERPRTLQSQEAPTPLSSFQFSL